MKKLFYLLALLVFIACNDEDRVSDPTPLGGNVPLATNVEFMKLLNDSTSTAGALEIMASASEVDLEWNVLPEFNVDTTVTTLKLINGRAVLPIKWNKQKGDSIFAPTNMAFSGGVRIFTENYSKYVPLVWADEVDSTYFVGKTDIVTRAGSGVTPKAASVIIDPRVVNMKYNNDDSNPIKVKVEVEGATFLTVDKTPLGSDSQLDLNAMPSTVGNGTSFIPLQWGVGGPPEEGFARHFLLKSGAMTEYIYVNYDEPYFRYSTCLPSESAKLPANNAMVIVKATTNLAWTIETTTATEGTVTVYGEQSSTALKTLVINIPNNSDMDERDIIVYVKAKDEVQKELKFKQLGRSGDFMFVSASPDPSEGAFSSDPINVTVSALSEVDWWIESNGVRIECPADLTAMKYVIPENTGVNAREVVLLVGYGNTIAKQLTYHQLAGNILDFEYITPTGDIPVQGIGVTLKFDGTYSGDVKVRAYLNTDQNNHIAESAPTSNKQAVVLIPDNFRNLSTRNIVFKYEKANAPGNWINIVNVTKKQDGATITGMITPTGNIPGAGGSYECLFGGTYVGEFQFRFITENGVEQSISAEVGKKSELTVTPNNMARARAVYFEYKVGTGEWTRMEERIQSIDPNLRPDGPLVGDFDEQIKEEVDVEL